MSPKTKTSPKTKEFADVVIGIENIYRKQVNQKKANIITGIRNCFQGMRRSAVVFQKEYADIWLQVDCGDVDIIGSKEQIEYCYQQGYQTMKQFLDSGRNMESFLENNFQMKIENIF